MTDASMNVGQSSLLEAPKDSEKAKAPAVARVAKEFGVSPMRQMRDIIGLRYGAQKLSGAEYYRLRLFDPARSKAEKAAFLGQAGTNALNTSMNPPVAVPTRAFVGNKLLYTALLDSLGLATSKTQALVSSFRNVGQLPVLRDAAAIETFLRQQAIYPLFGKPHHGSLSEGSVRIQSLEGDLLHLADGRKLNVTQFAQDVVAQYAGGFLLQTALDPHPEMARVAGKAVGCLRVVTTNDGHGPTAAYALWKLPAPQAMSDNFWQEGSLLAMVEMATGKVTRCQRGQALDREVLDTHPETGAAITGMQLPFFNDALQLACDAHAVFPEFGVCGFDIAITADGPKVLECNDNPAHMLYQLAADEGINAADLAPRWAAVADRQAKQVKRLNAK